MGKISIILYGRAPSKKNSKQRTGKYLISSKQYTQWEKEQLKYLKELNLEPIQWEVEIDYSFYRPDNRKTDIENKISSIQDMFVKFGLIEDDSWQIINSMKAKSMGVDKLNPRVVIIINKKN